MIDNRSAKHPAEMQETVDGRSADECLGARRGSAGVPQGLARGIFGGMPFGRVRFALRRRADPQGRPGAKESGRRRTEARSRCIFAERPGEAGRSGALPAGIEKAA